MKSISSFKSKVRKSAAGAGGLALLALLGIILFRKPGQASPPPLEPPPGSEPGEPGEGFKMPVTLKLQVFPFDSGSIIPVPQPPYYDGQTVDITYYPVGAQQFDHFDVNMGFPGGFETYSNPYRHTVVASESVKDGGIYYNFITARAKSTSPIYVLGGAKISWQLKL